VLRDFISVFAAGEPDSVVQPGAAGVQRPLIAVAVWRLEAFWLRFGPYGTPSRCTSGVSSVPR